MAQAQTATRQDVRQGIQRARISGKTQPGQFSRTAARPQGVQSRQPTQRAQKGQIALADTFGSRPVSEPQMYHETINEQTRAAQEAEHRRRLNRERIQDYTRALAPLPAVIESATEDNAVERDRMQQEYARLSQMDRSLPTEAPARSRIRQQLNAMKAEARASIEKKAKAVFQKSMRNYLYSGAEVASEADLPGTVAWIPTAISGSTALFSVGKTAVGIDKVFFETEPPKISMTDVSTWGIAWHAGAFILIFGLAVFPLVHLILGVMGTAAAGIGLFAETFRPFVEWTSWAASLVSG